MPDRHAESRCDTLGNNSKKELNNEAINMATTRSIGKMCLRKEHFATVSINNNCSNAFRELVHTNLPQMARGLGVVA